MKAESQKQLIEKYPKFFEYLKEHKGPVIPIQFGFECGDGWYWLLDNLMGNINSYLENNSKKKRIKNKTTRKFYDLLGKWSNKLPYKYGKKLLKLRKKIAKKSVWEEYETIPAVNVTQIKEKFGGLCFYFDGGDDIIHGMVWLAESMSYKICETCGTTENVHQTKGWIYTICDNCENKKKNK